jgi:hypothetical protein
MASFNYIESSIPAGMSIAEYRRARATSGSTRRRRKLRLRINLRVVAREATAATA